MIIEVLLLTVSGLIIVFGLVILRGAPFLPTLKVDTELVFELMPLKKGDTMLELGSGDGRVLRAAAERGIYSVGFELNPLLVIYSRLRHWRYRRYIRVVWGDFWKQSWPEADGMYVFLLEKYMPKLDKAIIQKTSTKNYFVVSNTFTIPNKKIQKTKRTLHLYSYDTTV